MMKNFGLLKEAYIDIMVEGIKTNNVDKKDTYKNFIQEVKKNPVLKKQAKVFSLLEKVSSIDEEKRELYINEVMGKLTTKDKKDMLRENIVLCQTLFEYNIDLANKTYPKKELHESISNLLFLKSNLSNVTALTESKFYLLNKAPIVETKVKKLDEDYIPTKLILKTAIDKINKTYPNISESEVRIIASVINGGVKEQTSIFESLKEDCTKELNGSIEGANEELVNEAIDKIKLMEYNKETYPKDIVKLFEFKNSFQDK